MRDPLRVQVSGPLEPFASGFVAELGQRGYARVPVVAQMQLVAHLSRWMAVEGVAAAGLSGEQVQRFGEARRVAGYRHFLMARSLVPLLGYLRGLGEMPAPAVKLVVAPDRLLVVRYCDYLVAERGLAPKTVRRYEGVAQRFLGVVLESSGEWRCRARRRRCPSASAPPPRMHSSRLTPASPTSDGAQPREVRLIQRPADTSSQRTRDAERRWRRRRRNAEASALDCA